MALERLVSPERLGEAQEAAQQKGWTLSSFLSHALEMAAMDSRFANEAGCDGCALVPMSHTETQDILQRFDSESRQRIDQILRGWVLEKLASPNNGESAACPPGGDESVTAAFFELQHAVQSAFCLIDLWSERLETLQEESGGPQSVDIACGMVHLKDHVMNRLNRALCGAIDGGLSMRMQNARLRQLLVSDTPTVAA